MTLKYRENNNNVFIIIRRVIVNYFTNHSTNNPTEIFAGDYVTIILYMTLDHRFGWRFKMQ